MNSVFSVASSVEGHGECSAVPVLLRRLVLAIDPSRWLDAKRPIRLSPSLVAKGGEFERRVDLAARLVKDQGGVVLILVDGDDDCAATRGPELHRRASACRPDVSSAAIVAVREFEAWYLASADSLGGARGLPTELHPPPNPELVRDAKGWLQDRRTDGLAYSPTVDQPALAEIFDMARARLLSPSFDKMWRDVERLLSETAG